jgi:hypothetical protein
MAGPWEKYAAQPQQGGLQRIGPANSMRELDETYKRGQIAAQGVDTAKTVADMNKPQVLGDTGFMFDPKTKTAAPIPGFKPKKVAPSAQQITRQNELRDKLSAMKNLEANLIAMEDQYRNNLAGQPMSRGFGLSEFLPDFMSADNQKFNKLAKQTGPYIMSILGMSGKATDAAAEYEKKVMPFIPKASDMDSTNAQTLKNLRDMLNANKAATYKELGIPYRSRRRKSAQKQASDDGWSIEEVK